MPDGLNLALKSRKAIVGCRLAADVLWVIYYFCKGFFLSVGGAYTGMMTCCLIIGREIVCYNRGRKWADSPLWLLVFAAAFAAVAVFTWDGPVSLLAPIGSFAGVVGYHCKKTMHMRILNIPCYGLWLVYSILVFSVTAVISNSLALVCIAFGMVMELRASSASRRAASAPAEESKTEEK